jgi:succinyl-diaminopimelate desuccinylase
MDLDIQDKVIRHIHTDEIVEFLSELVRTPSINPPGDEQGVAEVVGKRLRREGITFAFQEVAPNRPNVIARLPGSSSKPVLLFNAHMDTVPSGDLNAWAVDPLAAEVRDGKLFGRGATDDKGGLACMVMAAVALKRAGIDLKGDLVVAAVVGEETGGLGTQHLLDSGLEADMAIVGEWSTPTRIALGYRGRIGLELVTHGRAAHASRPASGVNAIDMMTELVLPALKKLKLDYQRSDFFMVKEPTLNIGTIQGGTKTNVVPDLCRVTVDMRLMPGQISRQVCQQIEESLNQLQRHHDNLRVDLHVSGTIEPFVTSPDEKLVRVLSKAIRQVTGTSPEYFGKSGTSDANLLVHRACIPALAYGPGNPSGHGPNEYVDLAHLAPVTQVYALTALAICGDLD